jgi:ribosomal protein S18 acetylase RimI-like enzyme
MFRNPDLIGHVYVGPYVVGQPDFALVVADADGVAGYLLAAPDTRAFEAWMEAHWWPPLRRQYPRTHGASPDDDMIRSIHHPTVAPARVVDRYPAHLHIDLLERVRGRGIGRALVQRTITALRERVIPGVHLDVAADNKDAIAFYERLGFRDLERRDDSILMGLSIGSSDERVAGRARDTAEAGRVTEQGDHGTQDRT